MGVLRLLSCGGPRHFALINMTVGACITPNANGKIEKRNASNFDSIKSRPALLIWSAADPDSVPDSRKESAGELKEMSPLGRSTELTFKQFQTFC